MAGDETRSSIEDLVHNHLDSVFRYAYRLTDSREQAEDLAQETYLIAARKIDQLRDPDLALAWLLKILRSCLSRQRRRKLPVSPIPVEEIELADVGSARDVDLFDSEKLLELLRAMPDEFREPLVLFYFEELKYRDIADVLNLPVGTVMSRIARGKAYLRERWAAHSSTAGSISGSPTVLSQRDSK